MEDKKIITIDGSAWTGKSTVAKALAKMLGYQYLNTGGLFKAVAYFVKKQEINFGNIGAIVKIVDEMKIDFKTIEGEQKLLINGEDVTNYLVLNENDIVSLTSKIARISEVREKLMRIQREICKEGGFVVEGRDMGTIVFPEAKWKFFLDASLGIKIKRFFKTLPENEKGKYTKEEVRKLILDIDEKDKNRKIAPLKKPDDAIVYDNSDSPTAEQDAVVLWYYITQGKAIVENSLVVKNKIGAEQIVKR